MQDPIKHKLSASAIAALSRGFAGASRLFNTKADMMKSPAGVQHAINDVRAVHLPPHQGRGGDVQGSLGVAGVYGGQEGPGRAVPEHQVAASQGLLCHLPIGQLLSIASAKYIRFMKMSRKLQLHKVDVPETTATKALDN